MPVSERRVCRVLGQHRSTQRKTLYMTPGSPWENGYCESFNGSMRDELLNGEIFYTLAEAKILIEAWRRHYNSDETVMSGGHYKARRQTAQLARLSATGPGSGDATMAVLRFRYAPPTATHGAGGNHALTNTADHSVGAGQYPWSE